MFVFQTVSHARQAASIFIHSKHPSSHLIVAACITVIVLLASADTDFTLFAEAQAEDRVNTPTQTSLSAEVVARLRAADWTRQAAVAVSNLNETYFSVLAEYPERFELVLQRLERLGNYENLALMPRLEKHPELAALYANATVPMELDRAFVSEDCAGVYSGMFQLITDSNEQRMLADAFRRYGSVICDLGERGIPAPATLFMFDHNSPGAKEYARWLNDALKHALRTSQKEESLTEIVALAFDQGDFLRKRLARDEAFRHSFRSQVWPAFMRVTDCSLKQEACYTPFELLADSRRVWDVLMLDDGEELLERGGLQAIYLLTNSPDEDDAFSSDLRPLAQEALLSMRSFDSCDASSVQNENENADGYNLLCGLIRFQKEPLFRKLMLRDDIDSDLRQQVLEELRETCPESTPQCPNLEKKLGSLNDLSLSVLREDLGPKPDGIQTWIPGYDSYYIAKKLVQGREVDVNEIAFAALEVVPIPIPSGSKMLAKSGKLLTQTIKKTEKSLARDFVESVAKKTAKHAMRSQNRDLLEKAAEQGQLTTALAKRYFKSAIDVKKDLKDLMSVDITKPVQIVFNKTGVGRKLAKQFTGLEARVFMRKDARVILNPLNKDTVQDINEEVFREFLDRVAKKEGDEESEASDFIAWQEQASAWWFEQPVSAGN